MPTRLLTVEANGTPVLVISTDVEPLMEDRFTTEANLMRAAQASREIYDGLSGGEREIIGAIEVEEGS